MPAFAFVRRFLAPALFSCLVLVAGTGCGGGPGLAPVSGEVTVNGKPLAKGSLSFKPEAGAKATSEPAGTIENGKYTIYTNAKPGAPLGKYKVVVAETLEIDSTKPLAAKSVVDKKYSEPDKTDLQIEVVDKPAPGAYDLKLK